jgi:hypothetical protein
VSESHDEVLEQWYRLRAEARLRAFARQQASQRLHAVPPICRNPALQLVGVRELTEAEQDSHDQRFMEGKYAPKSTHVNVSCSTQVPAGNKFRVIPLRLEWKCSAACGE